MMTSPAHSTQSSPGHSTVYQPAMPLIRQSSLEKQNAPVPLPRQRGKSLPHGTGSGPVIEPKSDDIIKALLRRKSTSSTVRTPAIAQRRDPQATEAQTNKGTPNPIKRRVRADSFQEDTLTSSQGSHELAHNHQQPRNGILKRDTSQAVVAERDMSQASLSQRQFVLGQESTYPHQTPSPPQPTGSAWSVSTSDSSLSSDSCRSSLASRSSRSSESSLNNMNEKKVVFGAYQQPQRNSNSLTRHDAKQAEKRLHVLEQAMDAAAKGNIKLLEQLLRDNSMNDVSVSSRDKNGSTLVHQAAHGGHLDCLTFLLAEASTEDVTSMVDVDDRTPAMVAIENGHEDCLRYLLKVSGGEMETDDHSRTLLHFAAYHGQTSCFRLLLREAKKNGADLDEVCDDSGVTPAHVAAQQGHINCLYELLESNVDVLQGDNDDLTPADWAAKANQRLCHQYLTMVSACWTAKEELEQTQEKLERAMKENSSVRNQLSELKARHEEMDREMRRLKEDCEKRVKENRQDVMSMMTCFLRQIQPSSEMNSEAAALSRLSSSALSSSLSSDPKAEKWKSASLPRPGIIPPSLSGKLFPLHSLHRFQDESDDSSGEDSESDVDPLSDLDIRNMLRRTPVGEQENVMAVKESEVKEEAPQFKEIQTDV